MTLNEMNLKNVNGGAEEEKTTMTIRCPQCNKLLEVSIYRVSVGGSMYCPCCMLRLNFSKSMTDKAIEALKKVLEEKDRQDREGA